MSQKRIGIVVGKFNDIVTHRLAAGAREALRKAGIPDAAVISLEVPGSFEIPLAAQWLVQHRQADAVIALGAVIRGTTSHYDYVCSGVTSGLMNVQLGQGVPVAFGVLTCDTLEQAFDRAGGKLGNKGAEAAHTVLEMLSLRDSLATR